MPRKTIWTMLAATMFLLIEGAVFAQGFVVHTVLYDESAVKGQGGRSRRPPVISSSMTLFHAGKVYDWIGTVGELTVFEPAQRQFTILNKPRAMKTTVHFDELKEFQKLAEREIASFLQTLQLRGDFDALKSMEPLQFVLDPRFDELYDSQSKRLMFSSQPFRYTVKCDRGPTSDAVAAYMDWADWTARLNYALHPQALNPGPRLVVNESLRRRSLMPVEVELEAEFQPPLRLRAEHTIHWQLNAHDRTQIDHWNRQLQSTNIKEVTIHQYQRALLQEPGKGK
jgi:hypothetical protein